MIEANARNVRLLRELVGMGLMDCKRAFELAEREFGGDVVAGAAYLDINASAVFVKGDRHAWAVGKARDRALSMRRSNPDLDAAFPAPDEAAPGPAGP